MSDKKLEKLYTVKEVAAMFGIHPITVRKKLTAGEWPSLSIGTKSIRLTQSHVDEIIRISERPVSRTA